MNASRTLEIARYLTPEERALAAAQGQAKDVLKADSVQNLQHQINALQQSIKENPKSAKLKEWNNALVINQMQLRLHNLAQVTLQLVDIVENYQATANLQTEQMGELQEQVATVIGFFASLAEPENFRKIRNIAKLCPETKTIKPHDNP